MTVAAEKFPSAQRRRGVPRSQQQCVADAAGDQLRSAQDEGAHQGRADFGIHLDEHGDLGAIELHDLSGFPRAQLEQRASAGNHVGFARKLTRTVRGDQLRGGLSFAPDHVEPPADDHKTGNVRFACLNQHFASLNTAAMPVRLNAPDLIVGEGGIADRSAAG